MNTWSTLLWVISVNSMMTPPHLYGITAIATCTSLVMCIHRPKPTAHAEDDPARKVTRREVVWLVVSGLSFLGIIIMDVHIAIAALHDTALAPILVLALAVVHSQQCIAEKCLAAAVVALSYSGQDFFPHTTTLSCALCASLQEPYPILETYP